MNYKIGDIIKGQVTGIEKYGIFVHIDDKYSGLVHISEISEGFVRNVEDYVSVGDKIYVKVIEIDDENNRIKLSIKGIDYKHNRVQPKDLESASGFQPLKEHLDFWIEEKLKEIREQQK